MMVARKVFVICLMFSVDCDVGLGGDIVIIILILISLMCK